MCVWVLCIKLYLMCDGAKNVEDSHDDDPISGGGVTNHPRPVAREPTWGIHIHVNKYPAAA